MSGTFERVRACIRAGEVRLTRHGSAELDKDDVALDAVLNSIASAESVEDYASAHRGPSVLALHTLDDGKPLHVVWAFYKGTDTPAVLVTAYRPDPELWSADFRWRLR